MDKAPTPADQAVLDTCEQIEQTAATLYHHFADLFGDDEVLFQLWNTTAIEEENHAHQFVLARKIKRGLVDTVKVDRWKADNTLAMIRSVLDNVREHPPTLDDALRSAIKLESSLSHFHMDCVAVFTDGSLQNMFRAMMAADDGHVLRLKDAYDRLILARKES